MHFIQFALLSSLSNSILITIEIEAVSLCLFKWFHAEARAGISQIARSSSFAGQRESAPSGINDDVDAHDATEAQESY